MQLFEIHQQEDNSARNSAAEGKNKSSMKTKRPQQMLIDKSDLDRGNSTYSEKRGHNLHKEMTLPQKKDKKMEEIKEEFKEFLTVQKASTNKKYEFKEENDVSAD